MLLIINRDVLLKPLLLTTGFVEKKQTMPILSNVYIKKFGNQITIISNDMEIQVSITIEHDMSGEDFTITLPAKKLQDILKIFPENTNVTLKQDGNKILISCGATKFTLQSLPADHYPLLKISDTAICQFTLEQTNLKTILSQIQYAMADKDSRVFLNGMLFEIRNNQLRLIATDAHRLGFVTTLINEVVENSSIIIPRKTIAELYKLLEDSEEPVTLTLFANQVSFETLGKQLISKVIDGKYPDYERVIPLGNDKLCLINRTELLRAIERVGVIGIDKLKTVAFDIAPNTLVLTCRNEDQEDSHDEIKIVYQGTEQFRICFNITYVRDLLTNSQAETLQWAFYDGQRSVLVTIPTDPNFKAVLMPLRN
ncbi:MAG: DNA polymerase III subunit beta [Burkholderiales bacterium]|nr:DNA polymerase III subunit beta [Burkholderiales bacterium]